MAIIFGFKKTMTQTWSEAGRRQPVTVMTIPPLTVVQVKTPTVDGYHALKVGFSLGSKPRHFREIRLSDPPTAKVQDVLNLADLVKLGDRCHVTALSKGHGFSGVVKRWGFKGGPKTHGQSDRQRAPGSIGQGTDPGRVHKGKKMAGHSGQTNHQVKNLQVVKIDPENQELWLNGPVPGAVGTLLKVTLPNQI